MPTETFVEQKVMYTLEVNGRFVIVEQVPARVSLRTGERFFSPETVERLQQIVWGQKRRTVWFKHRFMSFRLPWRNPALTSSYS